MNKFKFALMIGLIGSSVVTASQRTVDNDTEWDDYYNDGLNPKGDGLDAAPDDSSWFGWGKQKFTNYWWPQKPTNSVIQPEVSATENEGYADEQESVAQPVVPVVQGRKINQEASPKLVNDVKRVKLSNVTKELSMLNDRAIMTDKNMHRFTFGALVALQNGDVNEAINVLDAGLTFINNKVADGYDIADYQLYIAAFSNMLGRLDYVVNR